MKKKKPLGQNWIVSRSLSRLGGQHVQARTEDQLSSFAVATALGSDKELTIFRGKSPEGDDVFTLVVGTVTFNVFGRIKYEGDWRS